VQILLKTPCSGFVSLPRVLIACLLLALAPPALATEDVQTVLIEIFEAAKKLQTPDLVDGIPDYSAKAVETQKDRLAELRNRLDALDSKNRSRSEQVDFLLVRSELDKLEYGLYVYRATSRSPNFYLSAISSFGLSSGPTLSTLGRLVMQPAPFDKPRAREIIEHMRNIPRILQQARQNLTEPTPEMSRWALLALADARNSSKEFANGLARVFPGEQQAELHDVAESMGESLESYRAWIESELPNMTPTAPIGGDMYDWILSRIWLLPYDTEDILEFGEKEYARYVSFTALEEARNAEIPWPESAPTTENYAMRTEADELLIRDFLVKKDVLTVPEFVGSYRRTLMPDYIQAFDLWAGLSGYSLAGHVAVKYSVPENHPYTQTYWEKIMRIDASTNIFHDGIPGHHFQGVVSSMHPSKIRARRIDRFKSEGWSTYWEEAAIQLGFYDDRPRSRELLYNFLRLRALRVIVDVKMATGQMTVAEATTALMSIPMDERIASEEAGDFFAAPTGGIVYLIGKLQIEELLSERRISLGDDFDLRAFHDDVVSAAWVPLELTRWEMTGNGERVRKMLDDKSSMPR